MRAHLENVERNLLKARTSIDPVADEMRIAPAMRA
jgi:hypothetical protein